MDRPKGYTARIEAKGYKSDENWPHGTRKWGVTIVNTKTGKSASFPYHTGPAILDTPTLQDVAQALITDGFFYEDNPTLAGFARETGYSADEQDEKRYEIEKCFNACRRASVAMRRVFGEDLENMAEWCAGI